MDTKTIRQRVTFKATPHEIYEILMDSRKHSKLTGSKATVSRKVGGSFSVFDGGLSGVNLELVPDRKIVQSWRLGEWPGGYFSRATFSLKETSGGSRLNLRQMGVPVESYEDVRQGWHEYYWKPMKKMLQKKG
ncbi:MAG: SRPBCC domain-containing protein [Chloroflexi bacterium]|nr:SRPBCC domain-containing protein [Chloroflexota bacterium]